MGAAEGTGGMGAEDGKKVEEAVFFFLLILTFVLGEFLSFAFGELFSSRTFINSINCTKN